MPLYEYYCQNCDGIFEAMRPMREASLPVPCIECNQDAPRIMSSFNAFTFREGYPRRLPDRGTYWHLGQEVKKRVTRMKGREHPELAPPKSTPRPLRGDVAARRDMQVDKHADLRYRDRWGVDARGKRAAKAKSRKPKGKVVP